MVLVFSVTYPPDILKTVSRTRSVAARLESRIQGAERSGVKSRLENSLLLWLQALLLNNLFLDPGRDACRTDCLRKPLRDNAAIGTDDTTGTPVLLTVDTCGSANAAINVVVGHEVTEQHLGRS